MLFKKSTVSAPASAVIEHARGYVGMRSRAFKSNGFGAKVGFSGKPWDGSFLATVLLETGVSCGVSLVSTTAALSFFNRTGRIFQRPAVGDLVFFAWSTDDDGFGQPHVGLVTDVRDWKTLNRFRSIEAQVSSGMPKGPTEEDGVFERTRYGSDVLAFVRPKFMTAPSLSVDRGEGSKPVRLANVKLGAKNSSVVAVQRALSEVTDAFGFDPGRFDSQTRSAFMRFQVESGLLDGDGTPDVVSLELLAARTQGRFFHVVR